MLQNLRKFYISALPKLRFLPATMFKNRRNFNCFNELDVSNNANAPFSNVKQQLQGQQNGNGHWIPTLCHLAAAAVLNNPLVNYFMIIF